MTVEDEYKKASDYDLDAQKHNRRVFRERMSRRPWLSLFLSGLSGAVGVRLVLDSQIRIVLLGCMLFFVSGYFLAMVFNSFNKKEI